MPPTALIESLSHEGRGVAHINGKAVFIHNALPGETVEFCYKKRHRSHDEGEILAVIANPSPYRTQPPCQHYHVCGGCQMQHIAMEHQLAHKQNAFLEQLKHFGNVTPEEILPALHAQSLGYRSKARIGVRYVPKKGRVLIGFRERYNPYVADLEKCVVLHPFIGEKLTRLANTISQLSCYQQIPQLEIAVGDDKPAIIFRHMAPLTEKDKAILLQLGKEEKLSIYLQPNPPLPITRLFPTDSSDFLSYTLPNHALRFEFHPTDFTQINIGINHQMIDLAISLLSLKADDVVLDLFCGIGNFSLPIARHAKSVVGVELSKTAVARAEHNAALNQLENTRFFVGDLFTPSTSTDWMKQKYTKILLDPARTGAKEIIEYFPALGAQHIVYVSCNPATFARDAGILVNQQGFRLVKAGIMNMFPHTAHVESIALFLKD